MNKRRMKKGLAIVLALVMVFAMTATAFAETPTIIKVSVLENSFNTDGTFKAVGSAYNVGDSQTPATIVNYEMTLEELEEAMALYGVKSSFYLPSEDDDVLNGAPSIIDAIIVALLNNNVSDLDIRWDPTNVPASSLYPGAYIHNINSDVRVGNTVTPYPEAGEGWYRSVGSGWNVAYRNGSGAWTIPQMYTSRIGIPSGTTEIIIDLSLFDMIWQDA